jgi:hypothetical protein
MFLKNKYVEIKRREYCKIVRINTVLKVPKPVIKLNNELRIKNKGDV